MEHHDLIIVGGGPCGLACGIEAEKNNFSYKILEKGNITEAIRHFPVNMRFFSSPELLELGGLPFPITEDKPSRAQALEYYRKVVDYFKLKLEIYQEVTAVEKQGDQFVVSTKQGTSYRAQRVILAIGYFDHPNFIQVPGEDRPHVSHYYDEPYKYSKTNVVVVGGKNSAVDTALDLYRHDARVTLVHRREKLGDSVKYWILPDIKNRIKEGSIDAHFNTQLKEIREKEVILENNNSGEQTTIPADFVFLMTGYHPDAEFLEQCGIKVDKGTLIPDHQPDTFETNVPGLYVAGSAACGCEISNIFIENGRMHAQTIFKAILAAREKTR